ncbi:glycine betaine ABC transporter substrate-binding protein [Rhodococcus gannanensis]|uniref:Glycine betaine ABC transporter substrate-binding protein n=1 Tax=Rhodococcus gannanensis TaxID=1960308 RepID=A0ABW4P3I0_9NOCA
MRAWTVRGRAGQAAGALVLAAVLGGCSTGSSLTDDPAPGPITVGAGESAESQVVAEIYAEVLRGTGSPVSTRLGLGAGDTLAMLDSGEVTLVPEYTGPLLLQLNPNATVTDPADPDEVFAELNRSLPQGLSVSDQGLAEDPATTGEEGERAAANVVPLMRAGALTTAQVKALNVVAGELTSEDLADMGETVRGGERSPGRVAGDWLAAR